MKKRSDNRKLLLSRETVRTLIPEDMSFVAGGLCARRISAGLASACDCSGSATATGTCTDCSSIQY